MKKVIPMILGLAITCSIPGVHTVYADEEDKPSSDLRILFTNDLHDRILSSSTVQSDNTVIRTGGYAYLAKAIEDNRNDNTIVLDGGDFSTGGVFNELFEDEAPDLTLMGKMGYDAVSLGDAEFDYGTTSLAEMLNSAEYAPDVIASNIEYGDDSGSEKLEKAMNRRGKTTKIIDKNGIKVGIFSVITDDTAKEISDLGDVSFTRARRAARNAVKDLQDEGADYIIGLVHGGNIEETDDSAVEDIASSVDGIDLIISGHNHTAFKKAETVNDTSIVSSGCYGENLGVVDVDYDSKNIDYHLVKIDTDGEKDQSIDDAISEYQKKVQEDLFSPYDIQMTDTVAQSSFNFDPISKNYTGLTGNNTGDLVADAFANAYSDWYENWYTEWSRNRAQRLEAAIEKEQKKQSEKAEAQASSAPEETEESDATPEPSEAPEITAIRNERPGIRETAVGIAVKGMINDTFYEGDINASDVYNVVGNGVGTDGSNGTSLVLLFLKGSDLRELAEYDATVGKTDDPADQMFFSGMKYDYSDYRMDYNHVEEVYVKAVSDYYIPVDNDAYYPVITNLEVAERLKRLNDITNGKLSVTFYDENQKEITDPDKAVLKTEDGYEVKEYTALISYMHDFERNDEDIPSVPATYSKARVVKNIDRDFSLITFFKNTSSYALHRYILILVIIAAVIAAWKLGFYSIRRKK